MAKHQIEIDGYVYSVDTLNYSGISAGALEFYAHFAKAFEEAEAAWEKRLVEEPRLAYFDSFYADSLVLAADGCPVAIIANIDDLVQVVQIPHGKKIEEIK